MKPRPNPIGEFIKKMEEIAKNGSGKTGGGVSGGGCGGGSSCAW